MRFSTDSEVFCVALEVFTQKQQVVFRNGHTHVFCHIAWLFDSSILQIRTFPAKIPFPNPSSPHSPTSGVMQVSCIHHASGPKEANSDLVVLILPILSSRRERENYPPNMAQVTFKWRCEGVWRFKCFFVGRKNYIVLFWWGFCFIKSAICVVVAKENGDKCVNVYVYIYIYAFR